MGDDTMINDRIKVKKLEKNNNILLFLLFILLQSLFIGFEELAIKAIPMAMVALFSVTTVKRAKMESGLERASFLALIPLSIIAVVYCYNAVDAVIILSLVFAFLAGAMRHSAK